MFFPEELQIENLTAKFQQEKARIWADDSLRPEEKGPAVEMLWRDFDRRRNELRSAAREEAPVEEQPRPHRPLIPRSRRRYWK